MNVLFLTLYQIDNINNRGIYEDLLREFIKNGHDVYIVSPVERRFGKATGITYDVHCHLLSVKTGNIQKSNLIEKGIATVLLETQFIVAIKKYFSDVKFDLVLYSTPPITLAGVVEFIKKRDNAKTYLLLKDIFPQNAIDIGLMSKTGIKGLLYKYFRCKEKKLYAISDKIGCMSPANVQYVLEHNPEINSDRVEVCPNCIDPIDMSLTSEERKEMRDRYGIPHDKKVFVYGGNLGKPQGIPILIECLRSQKLNQEVFFLIVGDGTEYEKIDVFVKTEQPSNVKLMQRLPKEDYDRMIAACDVGMILLDYRFTIPNFPSRLLSYMQAGLPILACTDSNTDVGKVVVDGGFGWWCKSDDAKGFSKSIEEILCGEHREKQENAWKYMRSHYSVERAFGIIEKSLAAKKVASNKRIKHWEAL